MEKNQGHCGKVKPRGGDSNGEKKYNNMNIIINHTDV